MHVPKLGVPKHLSDIPEHELGNAADNCILPRHLRTVATIEGAAKGLPAALTQRCAVIRRCNAA